MNQKSEVNCLKLLNEEFEILMEVTKKTENYE